MPKKLLLFSFTGMLLGGLLYFVPIAAQSQGDSVPTAASRQAQSVESKSGDPNFDKMMAVLTHKRCVNCHPSDGVPKQGEDSHPHYFGIRRGDGIGEGNLGEGSLGFAATKCTTCHQSENNEYSGVPGAPEWSLAPESMRWAGLSPTEIAKSMLDPKRNGNRDHEQVMHHLTEHELVLWAWEPGVDANGEPREKPPVPKDEYIAAVKQWFADGAKIPQDAKKAVQ